MVCIYGLEIIILTELYRKYISMRFTAERAAQLVKIYYGLEAKARTLSGEYDYNYLLIAGDDSRYIFKISGNDDQYEFLDAQVKIINHLSQTELARQFNQYVKNKNGQELTQYAEEGKVYQLRLLTYLEGDFWINLKERSDSLHCDLGNFLGKMDRALQGFSHPAMHRKYLWDISRAADANKKLHYIKSHERRRIAGYFYCSLKLRCCRIFHHYVMHTHTTMPTIPMCW